MSWLAGRFRKKVSYAPHGTRGARGSPRRERAPTGAGRRGGDSNDVQRPSPQNAGPVADLGGENSMYYSEEVGRRVRALPAPARGPSALP